MAIQSKEFFKSLVVAACVLTFSLGASAGKGGNKVSGTISLQVAPESYLVDGQQAASMPAGFPRYGDSVIFDVAVTGVSDNEITTSLRCFQDGATVYYNRNDSSYAYTLSNEADHSWSWDGGSATCLAVLGYCASKGKKRGTCETLDSTEFFVSGSESQ